jgi:hypothetical protein
MVVAYLDRADREEVRFAPLPVDGDFRERDLDVALVFLVGSLLRDVPARSRSSCSDIESAIALEAPLNLDFEVSPRLAESAAPAAICCFFDRAGMWISVVPSS